jgi:UDP-N-acetylglucosamine 4,6-dehydratase
MATLTASDLFRTEVLTPYQEELLEQSKSIYNGASILITGATGSFGKAFLKRLLTDYDVKKVIVFSRDELKQSEMMPMFPPSKYPQLRYFLGDVRDRERLMEAFRGIDIVVHAAALKQVPALEYNPQEAIKTNVHGALNVIHAAIERGVKYVCALSTDKAATPINLYGATKLCSDKLFVAANMLAPTDGSVPPTKFFVVRYGNVFGSRGSIVPVFHKMKANGEVTITDPGMTRFTITLHQAVNFVLTCMPISQGGEVYVPKIPSYRIDCIAKAIAPECTHTLIGRRPGEKLHEVMVPEDDAYRTFELEDRYSIEPEWAQDKVEAGVREDYVGKRGKRCALDFTYDSGANEEWVSVGDLKHLYKIWAKQVLDEDIEVTAGGDDDYGTDLNSVDVCFTVDVKVKPGTAEAFIAASKANCLGSRLESGCVRFDLMQSPEDENAFVLYEAYKTVADVALHKETAHYKTWAETVEPMMAEPRKKTPAKMLC